VNHNFANDEIYAEHMGLMTSYRWKHDPKTVLFMLSRYKFVAKMLEGYRNVLEVGCGDAFGSRLVAQSVSNLKCIDIDKHMLNSASFVENIYYKHTNEITPADAIYALDVIEHMTHQDSKEWVGELSKNAPVVIIGTPSFESQVYASELSKENHINCMSGPAVKALMRDYFEHVFMFSMNDEVVHTGFHKLAHYLFAIGVR
jgi:2-polyprenyl-3-methyl-5-hydroxy-6-metoxy-1,4-benzoquinol methylase